tara:strand:- start:11660 stop:11896 length:237 start_codon:yes stop_codon:yes gene_type:complete
MSFDGFVESVLINISSRKFVIFSDTGEERYIKCETPDEFMGVLKICKQKLDEEQIYFTPITSQDKRRRRKRKKSNEGT